MTRSLAQSQFPGRSRHPWPGLQGPNTLGDVFLSEDRWTSTTQMEATLSVALKKLAISCGRSNAVPQITTQACSSVQRAPKREGSNPFPTATAEKRFCFSCLESVICGG